MDMLIKLYELPPRVDELPAGVTLRKPIGPEHRLLVNWIAGRFGEGWASEATVALGHTPCTLWLALEAGAPIGFACYDATARGCFGPIGVADAARHRGIGRALLLACLHDMHAAGYAYAVAGAVGPADFFRRTVQAVEILGSEPGLYRGMLRA
jgi:GNAT superfamily N-acetyltransferase